jgi:hypothetical protein
VGKNGKEISNQRPSSEPQPETENRGNGAKGPSRFLYQRWENPDAQFIPVEQQSVADRLQNGAKNTSEIPRVSSADPQRMLQELLRERITRFGQSYDDSDE